MRPYLKSDPLVSVLIGLVVGLTAFCLALFLASDKNADLGGNSVGFSQTEQNLGVQYKNSWERKHSLAVGVTKVFAVPVWDNGQGLGNRMPNLITQPSQSPTIFSPSRSVLGNLFDHLRFLACELASNPQFWLRS